MNSEHPTTPEIIVNEPVEKNASIMEYFTNIANSPSKLFSSGFTFMYWFFSLRWYVIILSIVIGSFLFFQIESAFEKRSLERESKRAEEQKGGKEEKEGKEGKEGKGGKGGKEGKGGKGGKGGKEGMEDNVERMKGILRQTERENKRKTNLKNAAKHVSFHDGEMSPKYGTVKDEEGLDFGKNVKNGLSQIYNWWIVPWVYASFRSIGIR